TGGELALLDEVENLIRQIEQPHHVGDVRPALAGDACDFFLRMIELADKALIAARFLDRIEILALHIFDQRDFERLAVRGLAHQHRHFGELRRRRRAPAPLPGENLELAGTLGMRPYQERLEHALHADRFRQGFDLLVIEMPPRLETAAMEMLDRHGAPARRCLRTRRDRSFLVVAEQSRESATQAARRFPLVAHVVAASRLRSRAKSSRARWT